MFCPCGSWDFREIQVTTSLAAFERGCPKCRKRVLFVFRGPDHVASVELVGGRRAGWMEQALRKAGLSDSEVELLMFVAEMGAAS